MFYYPNRTQAIRIQETLKTVYAGVNGEYYFWDEAWNFIKKETEVDLLKILEDIAKEKTKE
jgi:type II restriction enzyme